MKKAMLIAALILSLCYSAQATTVYNRDSQPHNVTVRTDTAFTSHRVIRAKSWMTGICNAKACTFILPGSSIFAGHDDSVTIRDGRFFPGTPSYLPPPYRHNNR
jgi:hypothetical protein